MAGPDVIDTSFFVIPAKAGIHGYEALDAAGCRRPWIPAFAGMTEGGTAHTVYRGE
jgi:hypothetical protein